MFDRQAAHAANLAVPPEIAMKQTAPDPRKAIERYALLVKLYASRLPATLIAEEEINRLRAYQAAGLVVANISTALPGEHPVAIVKSITPEGMLALQAIPRLDRPRKATSRFAR